MIARGENRNGIWASGLQWNAVLDISVTLQNLDLPLQIYHTVNVP